MTQCNSILEILKQQGIDPDFPVGERTAYDVLEGAINGALEEIEAEPDEDS